MSIFLLWSSRQTTCECLLRPLLDKLTHSSFFLLYGEVSAQRRPEVLLMGGVCFPQWEEDTGRGGLFSNPSVLPAGCELYAFCGALFGICSMITMTVIAIDRYFVITRPLTSIGVLSRKRALLILAAAWVYSLGWSLPPFFGWSEDSRQHAMPHSHVHRHS